MLIDQIGTIDKNSIIKSFQKLTVTEIKETIVDQIDHNNLKHLKMKLESHANVAKRREKVYEFLMKVQNYETLMPESNQRFEILNADSFLFQLSGMPEIQLEIKKNEPNQKVVLGSLGEKLPFTLTANINGISENESEVQLLFEGTFNSMMGMMIKGPIQKFINTLAENLGKI